MFPVELNKKVLGRIFSLKDERKGFISFQQDAGEWSGSWLIPSFASNLVLNLFSHKPQSSNLAFLFFTTVLIFFFLVI